MLPLTPPFKVLPYFPLTLWKERYKYTARPLLFSILQPAAALWDPIELVQTCPALLSKLNKKQYQESCFKAKAEFISFLDKLPILPVYEYHARSMCVCLICGKGWGARNKGTRHLWTKKPSWQKLSLLRLLYADAKLLPPLYNQKT